MKDKIFVDTNILVYANDATDKPKQDLCKQIILDGIQNENMVLSTQVLSEFYVTITKKIKVPLPVEIAKREIILLKTAEIVDVDYHSILKAIQVSTKNKISYWDSLIVASAVKAECREIVTEDMNDGQLIEGVMLRNPFIDFLKS